MARILIIDDDASVLELISSFFETTDHEVFTALDGAQGLKACAVVCPEVVITDILMSGKDGLEVVRELREKVPQTKIVAMSGGGLRPAHEYLTAAGRIGAVIFLVKPVSRGRLFEAVASALRDGGGEPSGSLATS